VAVAAFADAYAVNRGRFRWIDIVVIITTDGALAARNAGMAALVICTAAWQLISNACRHVSIVSSSTVSNGGCWNALLTSPSSRPSSSTVRATSAWHCSSSVTSVGTPIAL
jgi:hypothetical protein